MVVMPYRASENSSRACPIYLSPGRTGVYSPPSTAFVCSLRHQSQNSKGPLSFVIMMVTNRLRSLLSSFDDIFKVVMYLGLFACGLWSTQRQAALRSTATSPRRHLGVIEPQMHPHELFQLFVVARHRRGVFGIVSKCGCALTALTHHRHCH
jgi:hypothetical protein